MFSVIQRVAIGPSTRISVPGARQFAGMIAQVAQGRYMSSSMLTFASFRNSSDLHIYMDWYGK